MKTAKIVITFLVILLFSDITFAYGAWQGNWRWRNDDGDVYTATWKDSVNTPVVLTDFENLRLRISSYFDGGPSRNISLSYTEDVQNGLWIPITSIDTGKLFISSSQYLSDSMSYFDNQVLSQNSPKYLYRRTITFDESENYFLFGEDSSIYELEYSIKPTLKIQPGSAYFFSLCRDSIPLSFNGSADYAALLTSPINWTTQRTSETSELLEDVAFTDEKNGIAVGTRHDSLSNGVILRTTDGGQNWINQASLPGVELQSVCFTNANIGTVVGSEGIILKTTNGGIDWIEQTSGTLNPLFSVSFIDTNNGWAVGVEGTILRTTDGGSRWSYQSGGSTNNLYSVKFTGANTGTAVGYDWNVGSALILRTTNGGVKWMKQTNEATSELHDLSFIDNNNGWIVGPEGNILRTTDGGSTWLKVTGIPDSYWLNSVYFANTSTGWAVGGNGLILKTTDGGLSWIKLVSGTNVSLQSVHFVDSQMGWVAGDHGKILKTTNGGGITSVNEQKINLIPQNLYLFQNYPNPFNPTTKIKYSIPNTRSPLPGGARGGLITMKVYDVLGREVTTLVNESKQPGEYEVEFNASSLSSGVYFYQLKAGEFNATNKMILMK